MRTMIVTITEGEYSDYRIVGVIRIKDNDFELVKETIENCLNTKKKMLDELRDEVNNEEIWWYKDGRNKAIKTIYTRMNFHKDSYNAIELIKTLLNNKGIYCELEKNDEINLDYI